MDCKKKYILLDVGGTSIKGFLSNETGEEILNYKEYDSKSNQNAKIIFDNFYNIITELKGNSEITGIGFAFPGPFDYENGVSLMKNIGKYDSIFGFSFIEELSNRAEFFKALDVLFLHDIEAFALGCNNSLERAICICIGTGTGSAFMKNGKIIKEKELGVPENGWIYNQPYKDSIIDDYISARGLEKLAYNRLNCKLSGYELFQKCENGDSNAVLVFKNFGEILLDCLEPYLSEFQPKQLIFGGNISKSFKYFGDKVSKYCDENNIEIRLEMETSVKIIQGLIKSFSNGKL